MEAAREEEIKSAIESTTGLKLEKFRHGVYFGCIPNQHRGSDGVHDDITGHLWQACLLKDTKGKEWLYRFDPQWDIMTITATVHFGMAFRELVGDKPFEEPILYDGKALQRVR